MMSDSINLNFISKLAFDCEINILVLNIGEERFISKAVQRVDFFNPPSNLKKIGTQNFMQHKLHTFYSYNAADPKEIFYLNPEITRFLKLTTGKSLIFQGQRHPLDIPRLYPSLVSTVF